ncbi:MAG: energy transducer TonB [Bacteroidetes bacterium]|nr:energy transducer TonB [Bacteroidota bacterium]
MNLKLVKVFCIAAVLLCYSGLTSGRNSRTGIISHGLVSPNIPLERIQDTAKNKDRVFALVQEMPVFPGGNDAMAAYFKGAVKYPEEAKKKGVQGPVYIIFIVEKDGSLSETKVLKGIGSGCDEEALRAVKSMPKWQPGKQNGNPVRVQLHIPVNFKLDAPPAPNKPK